MRHWVLLFLFFLSFVSEAQQEKKKVHIKRATDLISIDGLMDETSWQQAEVASGFYQNFPTDTLAAQATTEMRFTYDDKFLYVGAKLYNTGNTQYVIRSLRRDFLAGGSDMFAVNFDTFDDQTNAFQFGINPYGVRREGLIVNGGNNFEDISMDWENKWFGEAAQHDGYWMVEMAIPFKSIRFKKGNKVWNMNAYRIDSHTGERSSWNAIPQNFRLFSLAYTGQLIWDKPLKNPGPNIAIIPYVSGNASASGGYIPAGKGNKTGRISNASADFGFDAKIGIGPALNLDLTVNPDFSQVEVDRQVTNLDRFEIFFPERRQFFLENADLFSQFGQDGLRPFFSRRIGVSRDKSTGQNVQNKINFGARLSGKLNNNWRLGLLGIQTKKIDNIGVPELNYTVAAIQRKVFARSNVGLIFINKQDLTNPPNRLLNMPLFTVGAKANQFNRVLGIDYNLASPDNIWNGKVFYHQSFENGTPKKNYATAADLSYSTIGWRIFTRIQKVGDNYNPEVGFARRKGFERGTLFVRKNFYPASGPFQRISPFVFFGAFQNQANGITDSEIGGGVQGSFRNTSRGEAYISRRFIYLFNDFDPTREGNKPLPKGSAYTFITFDSFFRSDARQPFFYRIEANVGQYFNGTRLRLGGRLNFRFIPYGVFSMDFNYNRIRLTAPFGSADLLLAGPRVDLTFTKNLFWTTFVQYNSQINNLNINSRLQWRFAPVSDLFVAYTDNYFPTDLINKNRTLVVKLTYWLNL